MTIDGDVASAELGCLREELLAAFEREGIVYPADRLEEALAEYGQLKRLIAVVAFASRANDRANVTVYPAERRRKDGSG